MSLQQIERARLVEAVGGPARANSGKSGIFTLADARDAFAARLLLADAAGRPFDAQSYIWHADASGGIRA